MFGSQAHQQHSNPDLFTKCKAGQHILRKLCCWVRHLHFSADSGLGTACVPAAGVGVRGGDAGEVLACAGLEVPPVLRLLAMAPKLGSLRLCKCMQQLAGT